MAFRTRSWFTVRPRPRQSGFRPIIMKKSPLVVLFVTVFIDLIGFGIVLPLLPFYAESFGANALLVGLLSTSFSLMQLLFAPVWGRLSDQVGRRPVILLGLLGSSVSYLTFGLAQSLPILFLSRVFAGIAGANISTAQAYIADSTAPEQRAKSMGLIGAAYGLGFTIGPAIGGLLSQYGYATPAFFASALALVNLGAAWWLLPESLNRSGQPRLAERGLNWQRLRKGLQHPELGVFLILFFISTFAFANLEATFALMTARKFGFDARANGYLFAYIGVLITIVQGGLTGRLARRFGEKRLISAGLFCMIFGLGLLPYSYGLHSLLLVLVVLIMGHGATNPSISSLISQAASAENQGGILGVAQSLASLARIVGPVWGGFTFDAFGFQYPYLTGSLFMAAAFSLSVLAVKGKLSVPRAA
ncbi:MAG: MFS transporter [Acidobacteria bacterium]|nr:MFS transporter [Acidobacteriota bacterium]MCI0724999.1 MFS transporter [Acidobacteriota bacterium]